MDRALWLLLWLRFRSWFRRLGRNARSARGLLLLVLGVLFFSCVFLNPLVSYALGVVPAARPGTLEHVQRFGPAVGLVANALGARAFSRRRQVVLAGLLLLAAVALLSLGRGLLRLDDPRELLGQLEHSAVAQAVLAPLGWFVHAFWAQNVQD